MTDAKPVPISKKVDNVKLGHPLPSRSPEKSSIQTRTVIQLGQPSSKPKTASSAVVNLDHPYTEPTTIPTAPTLVPSESSDWNKPSTSRGANSDQLFSLDLVKSLHEKARYHENRANKLSRVNQNLVRELKEERQKNASLQVELSYLKKRFKTLQDLSLTENQRNDVIRECLKPFFKSTQIELFIRGDWQNVHKWDEDSCRIALTLRTMSKKAYDYIYHKRIIPLPSNATLIRRFNHFQIPEGVKF